MDSETDLGSASRDALLALIARQQAVIAQLQRRVEVLEGKAQPGGPKGMPGIKPKAGRRPPSDKGPDKGPRKSRPHGFARRRMTATRRVERVLDPAPSAAAA